MPSFSPPSSRRRSGLLAAGSVLAAATLVALTGAAGSADAAVSQLKLAYTGDTATSINVTFLEAAADATTTAQVLARPQSGGAVAACATVPAPADCVVVPATRTDTSARGDGVGPVYSYFSANLTGLAPATDYAYLAVDSLTPLGRPGTFTTARGDDTPFTAVTYGETHVNDSNDVPAFGGGGPNVYTGTGLAGVTAANRVVRNLLPKAAFVISSGDNLNDGGNPAEWQMLLDGNDENRQFLANVPFLSALGDHEYKNITPKPNASPLYYAEFRAPRNGPVGQEERSYSYDYNGVHFTVIEASPGVHPSDYPEYWAKELAWLDADLADAAKRTRFQVVVMHHPPFHSKLSRVYPEFADPEFRDDTLPIFDRRGVELVISGHDAHNVRSFPLRGVTAVHREPGQPKLDPEIVAPGKGTTYIEQSTTGKNYDGLLDSEPWTAWSQDTTTMPAVLELRFGRESITGKFVRTDMTDPLTGQAYTMGKPVDSFSVLKVDPSATPPVGPAGPAGPAGADGAKGSDGAKGAEGASGHEGAAGHDGNDGAAGHDGQTGPVGATGAAGAVGAKGDAGAKGAAGRDARVACVVRGAGRHQRVRCSVSRGHARAGSVRLVRAGRTVARGSLRNLKPTRRIAAGRYALRVTVDGRAGSYPVRIG